MKVKAQHQKKDLIDFSRFVEQKLSFFANLFLNSRILDNYQHQLIRKIKKVSKIDSEDLIWIKTRKIYHQQSWLKNSLNTYYTEKHLKKLI
jgi:hypothetical protein